MGILASPKWKFEILCTSVFMMKVSNSFKLCVFLGLFYWYLDQHVPRQFWQFERIIYIKSQNTSVLFFVQKNIQEFTSKPLLKAPSLAFSLTFASARKCAFGRLNVFKADATLRPSRIDAPCERSSRHGALRNTRRRPAAWSPSGTALGLDPGTSVRRREEWTSGRASHRLSLIGLIPGGEVKGHRRTASGGLEEGLYLHPRPPAILVWRRTLSSPDAQRPSSLPAQSSRSHKVDLWSWIITPLHNGEVGKTKNTFFFFDFFF